MLGMDQNGHAVTSFKDNHCDFCGACEAICAPGALDRDLNSAWNHKAKFNANCLSFKGVVCRLCEESCEPQAIRFRLILDGRSVPLLDADKCNGCGGCQTACPADAVHFSQPQKEILS